MRLSPGDLGDLAVLEGDDYFVYLAGDFGDLGDTVKLYEVTGDIVYAG